MDTIQLHSLFDQYLQEELDLLALHRKILPWLPQLFEHRDDVAARIALEVDSLVDQIEMGEATEGAVLALLLGRRTASSTIRSSERPSVTAGSQNRVMNVPFTAFTVLDREVEASRRPSTVARTQFEPVSA